MARQKGSASFSGTLEILAGGPVDARTIVPTKADLTAAGTFDYKYVGMIVSVQSEAVAYMLTAMDTTNIANWKAIGSDTGQTIQVDMLPTATSELEGKIYQYIGATTSTLTNGYFYKCVESTETTGTYLWQAVSVQKGGGSGELGINITAAIDVGGIDAGTVYSKGTSYDTLWSNLLSPTLYPAFSNPSATLSVSGSKLLEQGSSVSRTFSTNFSRGSITPPYGTSGYRSGEATGYSMNGGASQATGSFTETVTNTNKSFQVTVSYAAGEQPKDSTGANYSEPLVAGSVKTNTITYEFVPAIWSNSANITTVAKEALISKSAKEKIIVFPAQTVANPEILDMPNAWSVTDIKMLNELSGKYESVFAEFSTTSITHDDASGTSISYTRYTDNRGYAASGRTIKVTWS